MSDPPRERRTARVVLFDPPGRVLLMKGRLPSAPDAPGVWFTVGGGMEAGETVVAAARREIAEETGFSQVDFGEELWRDENLVSDRRGRPVLVKDVFILARCAGGEPDRSGWQARERAFIDDIRWWDLDDLAAQTEPTWPPDLAARLIAVRRARAPGSATE